MVIKAERAKEGDPEAGAVDKGEKILDANQTQLGVAPAPGDHEGDEEKARRSTSKSRTSDAADDAGTIAEPEVPKQTTKE